MCVYPSALASGTRRVEITTYVYTRTHIITRTGARVHRIFAGTTGDSSRPFLAYRERDENGEVKSGRDERPNLTGKFERLPPLFE